MLAGTRWGCDYGMGRVGGDEGSGKELGGEEGQVVFDWEDSGFCVKMTLAGHLHAARADPEGSILEGLELGDAGGTGVREPDGGGIRKKGPNEGLICYPQGFSLLAPVGSSKGPEDVKPGGSTMNDGLDVR